MSEKRRVITAKQAIQKLEEGNMNLNNVIVDGDIIINTKIRKININKNAAIDSLILTEPSYAKHIKIYGTAKRVDIIGTVEHIVICGNTKHFGIYGTVESVKIYGAVESVKIYGTVESVKIYGTVENVYLPGKIKQVFTNQRDIAAIATMAKQGIFISLKDYRGKK